MTSAIGSTIVSAVGQATGVGVAYAVAVDGTAVPAGVKPLIDFSDLLPAIVRNVIGKEVADAIHPRLKDIEAAISPLLHQAGEWVSTTAPKVFAWVVTWVIAAIAWLLGDGG
jgi:hypothetical protein